MGERAKEGRDEGVPTEGVVKGAEGLKKEGGASRRPLEGLNQ